MTDTPPEIELLVWNMIMARSNQERFLMGCRMFEAARAMALASLRKDLPPLELCRQLFERMYGEKAPF